MVVSLSLAHVLDIDALHVIFFLYFMMSLICVVLVGRKAAPQLLCSVLCVLRSFMEWKDLC